MMMEGIKKRTKTLGRRFQRVQVDLNNRLQRSFGKRVSQKVEIHYRGKPFSFMYDDVIETVSIDVVQNDPSISDGKELHFDPTKRRMDMSDVFITCKCGAKYDVKVPTSLTGNTKDVMRHAIRTTPDLLKHDDAENGHSLTLLYIETNTEVIPEDQRIKNFNPERVNFYKLFSKKTTEVRYLVTYGQDLLAESPQYKYSDTPGGSKKTGTQNFLFFIFLAVLIEAFTILFVSSTTVSYTPTAAPSLTPWYILIGVVILLLSAMWRLHIHDMSKSLVKLIQLQSAPFTISNRGVLPVIMHNSDISDVWDYQAKIMNIPDDKAKEVIYALQTWSDNQIVELDRANKLGMVEHEVSKIYEDMRNLSKLDWEFRSKMDEPKINMRNVALAIIGTAFAYTFVLFVLGIF